MWLGTLDGKGPVYRQIYKAVRGAILDGKVRPGERLPSTRWVADDAGVGRTRVILAYRQLFDEGYVVGSIGSGTYVAPQLPTETLQTSGTRSAAALREAPLRLSRFARGLQTSDLDWVPEERLAFNFHYGRPSIQDFPSTIWRRLVSRQLRKLTIQDLDYSYGPVV